MACSCGCDKTKNGALLVYLGIFVLIVIVAIVGSCRGDRQKQPEAPKSAKERTQLMIEERMNDFDYTNGLQRLYNQQAKLIKERALAVRAFNKWQRDWINTNNVAKALDAKIQAAFKDSLSITNGVRKALLAEMDALVTKDAIGAALRADIARANGALAQHQGQVQTFIQTRISKQAKAGAKVDAEEAKRFRETREQARQDELKERLRSSNLRKEEFIPPPVREEGWWTNSAPYKAAAAQAATNQPPKTATETK